MHLNRHNALEENDANYALLKGAYLCSLYPLGYRTSNDIDVLVLPENKIFPDLLGGFFTW